MPTAGEFTFLFPTLLLERVFDDSASLNAGLRKLVLERELAAPGVTRSNVGGWHSESDFFSWDAPEVIELRERIGRALREYVALDRKLDPKTFDLGVRFEGWANVGRAGAYAKPHVHANSNISGVYYVDAGNPAPAQPRSGVIEFMDPRQRPQMFQTEGSDPNDIYGVVPKTSMLLLFPSFLYHYVNPYLGEGERINIAFNVVITRFIRRGEQPLPDQ